MRLCVSATAILAVFSTLLGILQAVDPTDEYRDADLQQTGYLPNHNIDPSVVNSEAFGQLWQISFNALELFYAKPLTYTPLAGGPQIVFLASNQNWIRTINAVTGAIINTRLVSPPFQQTDIGCGDIPNTIGITGTPTIDPATDIVYFFSKTYIPNYRAPGNTGLANGVYYFHAVNVNTLADVYPPVLVDGSFADNAPAKYFVGGVVLQRPSVIQVGSVVYGAFGGHCDLFNYTGLVVGVDINKAQVISSFAIESGPLNSQTNVLSQNGGGGQGGIWMSGMGIASDGARLFVATGNGDGHENQGYPAAGSSGCQTLGETALSLDLDSNGVITLSDYFQPYNYINMDAADQDLGSGGIVLLDPTVFSGTSIGKIAVTGGKNGNLYVMNANDLGGFKLGSGQTDGVLQIIPSASSIFGAIGSYPLEGGYIYSTPVGFQTFAYQLDFTSSGMPQFILAGQTNQVSAGRVGVGVPTITSLNGEPGTAILWMSDPDAGLRAWFAVPENGVLQSIPLPQVGGANKFQRPAFGNGKVYVTDANGILYCLGSPVNLPLNCTPTADFGDVALGTTSTQIITCTANIQIQIVNATVGNPLFIVNPSSLPVGQVHAGTTFSFPVTWNLTNAEVSSIPESSSGFVSPGIKSTPLTLTTINAVKGYTTSFPLSLIGTEVSSTPLLSVAPSSLEFGGVVILDPTNIPTLSGVITLTNNGLQDLTIEGYGYIDPESGDFVDSEIINGSWDLGFGFNASILPFIGSTIAATSSILIDVLFDPINGTQSYSSQWQIQSDGGTASVLLQGSASTGPIASLAISDPFGNWLPDTTDGSNIMDFGFVSPGSSSSLEVRICNSGGSVLQIEKSKPPTGVFHISDPSELYESQYIPVNQCAYGTVLLVADTEEYNVPNMIINNTWILNVDDLNFGIHTIEIIATVVSLKVGPVNSSGQTVYQYLGCFHEGSNGRLFPNQPYNPGANNDNANCQTGCYGMAQYAFAGTEYSTECWCGNVPPPLANQDLTDLMCNFACPGDDNDRCGAPNYLSVYYDPTKYTMGANPALYGPQTVQRVGNYLYQGCYSEATTGRALSGMTPSAPANGYTVELCAAACLGFTYFGVEYANE
ncbi:hypothetical protein G7Y89_g5318 [Cudoniella acicularis]|uniref:WSC domain-containing protein n=1 Tax=Cudoniella acicularis TaxID=354080 RepID=A0A8H4RP31_9HELO|nr:hypothetical protein G7Y89_g5318 [Cudoniella acicularis]